MDTHGLDIVRLERVVLSFKDLEVGRSQLMWTLYSALIWEIDSENRSVALLLLLYIIIIYKIY